MDYDYNNFLVVIERISGSSTSASENLDVKFKFNGSFDGGQSNPYYCEASVQGSNSYRNTNATENGELFFTNRQTFDISILKNGKIIAILFYSNLI